MCKSITKGVNFPFNLSTRLLSFWVTWINSWSQKGLNIQVWEFENYSLASHTSDLRRAAEEDISTFQQTPVFTMGKWSFLTRRGGKSYVNELQVSYLHSSNISKLVIWGKRWSNTSPSFSISGIRYTGIYFFKCTGFS